MTWPVTGREARPASLGWILLKCLGWTALFWAVFLALIPATVYALEGWLGLAGWRFGGPAATAAGAGLFAFGGVLGPTCAVLMAVHGRGTPLPTDCPRALVVAGPYRYVRNPMAIAGLVQGAGVGLMLGSPAVIAYALAGGPAWHLLVRPWEEADLLRRFGEPYRAYRAAVRCWLPRRPWDRPDG